MANTFWTDLTTLYPTIDWNDQSPPRNKFLLVEDEVGAEGSFFLYHLMQLFIRGQHRVLLLGFSQNFTHYNSVGRKLGLNLAQAAEKGLFTFIDCFSVSSDWIQPIPSVEVMPTTNGPLPTSTTTDLASSFLRFSYTSAGCLSSLYSLVSQTINKDSRPCLVLIDDISCLYSIVDHPLEVPDFLQYCIAASQDSDSPSPVTLIALAHNDIDSCETQTIASPDSYVQTLLRLRHSADFIFQVGRLPSGYSRDVHGIVSIRHRDNHHILSDASSFRYKVLESGAKLFLQLNKI
eukprot:GILI01021812.1.p1 GENE.GILI01021812.1~~GILI01021812.1.p1  ORF type:complete len:291 (-),score=23.71 GILI01021812.1:36-908(-)